MTRKSAIVIGVGAELGLGAALCKLIARQNYHVFVAGRSPEKLDIVARAITANGHHAESIVTDATSEQDVLNLFDKAMTPRDGIEPPSLVIYNVGNNRRVDFR